MTRLSDLFNIILEYDGNASYKVYNAVINDPVVAGVFTDSREVKAGSIFICISGNSCDGHAYINEAIKIINDLFNNRSSIKTVIERKVSEIKLDLDNTFGRIL